MYLIMIAVCISGFIVGALIALLLMELFVLKRKNKVWRRAS